MESVPFVQVSFHRYSVLTEFTGMYSIEDGKKVPSLIYVSVSDAIMIYYNVQLSSLSSLTLISTMREDLPAYNSLKINQLSLGTAVPQSTNGIRLASRRTGVTLSFLLVQ